MVLQSAEEYKEKGNAAYHDRDYANAAQLYGKAIAADPDNGVYYNNRAAAYLELKKYAEAAADAERSAILAPSAKANARHGKALWLLGRTAEAATAYERALRHDSENPEYKDALRRLKSGSEPSTAGGAGAAPRGPDAARATESYRMGLDAAIVITAVLSFFAIFLGLDRRLWQLMLASMLARQVVTLMDKHGAATLKTPGFWMDYVRSLRCTREFEGLYIMLCLAFLLLGGPSQQIFMVAAAVYAAVDLATNLGPQLRAAAPPALWGRLGPYMDKVRLNRDPLLLNAAAFEGLALFAGLLSGCPIGCHIAVVLFVRFRYNSDPCARMAWHGMYVQAASYAYSPRAPAVIGTIFGYIAGLLHRGATGA